jgi:hypothetical protein
MNFLNQKRLRDYPRLMFITVWSILLINLLLHNGWLSGLGQIIGSDFITLYSAGLIFKADINNLYNLAIQADIQQSLIFPTQLPGVNPYISPPYVAGAYSLLTGIPLIWALLFWSILTIIFIIIAVRWMMKYVLPKYQQTGLTVTQLSIIVLSFFPFIEGFQVGQNHGLTLLLISGIIIFSLSERWYLAGALAGFLIYKPQFVLGFLIIWLVWKKFKAISAFLVIAIVWAGSILIIYGISPYLDYLDISQSLFLLPYVDGFPGYLLITVYGFLSSILPPELWTFNMRVSQILLIVIGAGIAWIAYRLRNRPIYEKAQVFPLAILYPLIASPYVMLHDLLILVPAFVIISWMGGSLSLLYTAIGVYLAAFFLPLIANKTHVALLALIPIGLLVLYIQFMRRNNYIFMKHQGMK